MANQGDIGARHLISSYAEAVVEVPVEGDAALVDVDTPSRFPPSRQKSNALKLKSLIALPRTHRYF